MLEALYKKNKKGRFDALMYIVSAIFVISYYSLILSADYGWRILPHQGGRQSPAHGVGNGGARGHV